MKLHQLYNLKLNYQTSQNEPNLSRMSQASYKKMFPLSISRFVLNFITTTLYIYIVPLLLVFKVYSSGGVLLKCNTL